MDLNIITTMFCDIDDFCKEFLRICQKQMLGHKAPRGFSSSMSLSEIMTIIILFHHSNFRTFKHYYLYLSNFHKKEFPHLVSYSHFISLQSRALVPLCSYLESKKGSVTGISFIDSTPIIVCKNKRINKNKVFKGFARRGKSTIGWFFGLKLHLIINEVGELLAFQITPGNVDDRTPVCSMCKSIQGLLFGDKGYISKKLSYNLSKAGVKLITSIRNTMKNKLMPFIEKILLRKRSIIETVNDQLKNISQIEHTRHRSFNNCMINIIAGLIAYTWRDKKPRIKNHPNHLFNNLLEGALIKA